MAFNQRWNSAKVQNSEGLKKKKKNYDDDESWNLNWIRRNLRTQGR